MSMRSGVSATRRKEGIIPALDPRMRLRTRPGLRRNGTRSADPVYCPGVAIKMSRASLDTGNGHRRAAPKPCRLEFPARSSVSPRTARAWHVCDRGDPTCAFCRYSVCARRAGAEVLEVGIPFSEPLADGPVISARRRALAAGATALGLLVSSNACDRPGNAPLCGSHTPTRC